MQWKRSEEPWHRKAGMSRSQQKLMLILFFDIQGVVMVEWVPYRKNVDVAREDAGVVVGEPVCAPPWQHPHPPSQFNTKVPEEEHYVVNVPYPPYSPNLALCDFIIFSKLKLALKGPHLGDLGGIKSKMAAYQQSIPKSDFKRCYDDWLLRVWKCIATQGDKINL